MPSDLQVSNIKDLTGSNTGLSIASDGQVTIAQDNPTITLHATGDSDSTNTTFPAGTVLTVEQYSNNNSESSLDGSLVELESGSITTKGASSKILITYHFYSQTKDTRGNAYQDTGLVYIYRDTPSADTEPSNSRLNVADVNATEDNEFIQYITHSYLDSPSVTSGTTITYTLKFRGGEASYDDMYIYGGYQRNTLTLMEIAG